MNFVVFFQVYNKEERDIYQNIQLESGIFSRQIIKSKYERLNNKLKSFFKWPNKLNEKK